MQKNIYLTLLFILFIQDLFAQCAMCKAVATDAAAEEGSNINEAIMYIMVIPYILLFIAFRKKIFGILRQLRDVPDANKR